MAMTPDLQTLTDALAAAQSERDEAQARYERACRIISALDGLPVQIPLTPYVMLYQCRQIWIAEVDHARRALDEAYQRAWSLKSVVDALVALNANLTPPRPDSGQEQASEE